MAHWIAPQVEAELDEIWWYVAAESGDADIADRVIDSNYLPISFAFQISLCRALPR